MSVSTRCLASLQATMCPAGLRQAVDGGQCLGSSAKNKLTIFQLQENELKQSSYQLNLGCKMFHFQDAKVTEVFSKNSRDYFGAQKTPSTCWKLSGKTSLIHPIKLSFPTFPNVTGSVAAGAGACDKGVRPNPPRLKCAGNGATRPWPEETTAQQWQGSKRNNKRIVSSKIHLDLRLGFPFTVPRRQLTIHSTPRSR